MNGVLAKKRSHLIGLASIALSMVLVGCRTDPNLAFIQGVWYYNDRHLSLVPGEQHLESTWIFQRGTFEHSACCFIRVEESGWYRLVEADDRGMTLELYNLDGHEQGIQHSRQDSRVIRLVVDREADTLKIANQGLYHRITR